MEGLNLIIDANVNGAVQGLQQVEAQMKKAKTSGDVFSASVSKTSQSLQKLPQTSSQATQSLVNLSRVAQDAPFGFIGIANNINPLIESFQRLKTSTGTTGGALTALKGALTGPAGLGLAVGVASSLFLVFGDKILGITNSISKAEVAFYKFGNAIKSIGDELDKIKSKLDFEVEIQKLNLQLSGLTGVKLDIGGLQAERDANLKYINSLSTGIDQLKKGEAFFQNFAENIKKTGEVSRRLGGKESPLVTILKEFPDVTKVPEGLISQLSAKEQAGLKQYQQIVKERIDTQNKLEQALRKGLILDKQIQVKALPSVSTGKVSKENEDKYWYYTIGITKDQLKAEVPKIFEEINKIVSSTVTPSSTLAVEALFANSKDIARIKGNLEELGQIAATVGGIFTDAFGGLSEALLNGGNAAKAFAQAFVQALSQVITKLIQAAILSAIVSGFGGAVGGFTKFGDIFKFLAGFRADGGPVSGNQSYVVGERGPEIFVPSVSGNIIPNNQINGFTGLGGGSQGRMRQVVRGQNIVLAYARTSRSNNRLG